MSKICLEEALEENEVLKDQIAIVLAQKKGWRKSCDKLLEENKKLKEENKNLKNDSAMIRQQAVKEFAEKLKLKFEEYYNLSLAEGCIMTNDLLKEYGIGEE